MAKIEMYAVLIMALALLVAGAWRGDGVTFGLGVLGLPLFFAGKAVL